MYTGWDKLSLLGTDHRGLCDVTVPTALARRGGGGITLGQVSHSIQGPQ